ncbi:flagellar brake domain-containing protein [Halobacillus seohaensis]|uniref:Flagellar brake protein n=1 Tax=Halobacillus seohaensis TaxID=447421 RepID=A0ABW2EG33_9BACI
MFKVGTSVTLELHKNDEKESESFKCRLVDHAKDSIYIDYPVNIETQRTAFFFEGTQFQASFVGEDGSIYRFATEVVARRKMNIPVIVLTFPGTEELVRIQRRQYVRIDTTIDIAVNDKENQLSPFTTVTRDISGGGVAIIPPVNQQLTPKQILHLTLVLPMNSGEYYYIEATGLVIRSSKVKGSDIESTSIKFEEIDEKYRQIIIKYCFEQQMNIRKSKRL